MFLFGSSYPINKLALNTSLTPVLAASLRMFILFVCLVPFCKFKIPNKKYYLPLAGFSLSMGFGVFIFLNLSLQKATMVAPIIIGAQLAIPFAVLASSLFLGEKVTPKMWGLIFISFFGIFLIGYDPNLKSEIFAIFLCAISAFFYGVANVFSRYIKDIDVKLTNTIMGFTGFTLLFLFSIFFEGNTVNQLLKIGLEKKCTIALGNRSGWTYQGKPKKPLILEGVVKKIHSGDILVSGPIFTGSILRMGPSVLFETQQAQIVISSERVEPYDLGVMLELGIEIENKSFVLLKSRMYCRPVFTPLCKGLIECDSDQGGPTSSNYARFDFQKVRRPIFPLDALPG